MTSKSSCSSVHKIILCIAFAMQTAVHANSFDDFFKAIKIGDVKSVNALLYRGMDPNLVNETGQSALTLAVLQGQTDVALALIKAKGIEIDERNSHEETPLMLAALNGDEKVINALIALDAEVNKTGWTPLHYAASKGQLKAIEILLDNSAYIDAESPNQTTPLMMAAGYGTAEAVRLLLESGADPRLLNDKGLSAIDFAKHANQSTSVDLLYKAMKEWMIKYPNSLKP